MKRKHIPVIAIPLLFGITIMSLPSLLNSKMQHRLAEKAATCNKMVESTKEYLESKFANDLEIPALLKNENFCLARVIFRSPSHFTSSIWVNIGSDDSPIVKKNSPVIQYDSLIGVVEYVGKRSSLIRLITDTKMQPAVRVLRNRVDPSIRFAITRLQDAADEGALKFRSDDEKVAFMWMLEHCKNHEKSDGKEEFLAKGILQGQGCSSLLKGSGFNYDFTDEHGASRDLRSSNILQVGDLLVTSGLDGIFPEGLKVAYVHSIKPLSEGAFQYELSARPAAIDLQNIDYVAILEPTDFDAEDMPSHLDIILNQISN